MDDDLGGPLAQAEVSLSYVVGWLYTPLAGDVV